MLKNEVDTERTVRAMICGKNLGNLTLKNSNADRYIRILCASLRKCNVNDFETNVHHTVISSFVCDSENLPLASVTNNKQFLELLTELSVPSFNSKPQKNTR